jgi:hypothetical protein
LVFESLGFTGKRYEKPREYLGEGLDIPLDLDIERRVFYEVQLEWLVGSQKTQEWFHVDFSMQINISYMKLFQRLPLVEILPTIKLLVARSEITYIDRAGKSSFMCRANFLAQSINSPYA